MSVIEKIAVFAATEKIGLEILKKANEEGFKVTALVKDTKKVPQDVNKDNLKLILGDTFQYEDVEQVVKGNDAVLSALDSPDLIEGLKNIIKAMKEHHVTKLVVVSTAQLFTGKKPYFWGKKRMEDHAKQLEILREESDSIEWVAMMPDKIKDSPKIEPDYKVEKNNTPGVHEVTTAELADFMVKVFMDRTSIECFRHTKLGISSRPKPSRKCCWLWMGTAIVVGAVAVLLYYVPHNSLLREFVMAISQ